MNSASGGATKRLLLVELNEFDPRYLGEASAALGLNNAQSVLSLAHAVTTTDDLIEHQGLDPWVQWVGVHCGQPTVTHGVRRLGDTARQKQPQLWHALAERGRTWGVWGAMNAPLGATAGCRFFMPDPWSYEERAYPHQLNDLLALPRYVSRNYLQINYLQAMQNALRLARFFAPPQHWPLLAQFSLEALKGVVKNGPNVHTFTTLLDYLSVLCFIRARRKEQPDFSLIFLNHIAHLQHQFWLPAPEVHSEMELGLRLNDAMLGLLLANRAPDEALVVLNGLKQKNVAGQGFFVYRQKDPQRAAGALGVQGEVQQSMTHDAHVLCPNEAAADRAEAILRDAALSTGQAVFFVERADATRVFYQLDIEHLVAPDTQIIAPDRRLPFYDLFDLVCERTGAHVPEGDVYFDGIEMPARLPNHEIFDVVRAYFD